MFDLFADAVLTDSLKWEFVAWVCAGLMSVPFAVKNCIAIWQMLRSGERSINPVDYVSRREFDAHCNAEKETRDDIKSIERTLAKLSNSISRIEGSLSPSNPIAKL